MYPEASEERCTVAILVEVDPVGLVRNRRRSGGDFSLAQYVNDRPYAVSSFMSVALGRVFSTAMSGRSKERPELAELAIPFVVRLPVTPPKDCSRRHADVNIPRRTVPHPSGAKGSAARIGDAFGLA